MPDTPEQEPEPGKRRAGRPRRDLDAETVSFSLPDLPRRLPAAAPTQAEIADFTGVPLGTLEKAFRLQDTETGRAYRDGIAEKKASLQRCMWVAARAGNVIMQIWMSKNVLGWRDRTELDIRDATRSPSRV